MKPQIISEITFDEAEQVRQPSYTYHADFDTGRVAGHLDGVEALKQSIMCRLLTVQGIHQVYSGGYGLPMNDLIGLPSPLVYVRIRDAIVKTLMEDDRITAVGDFIFDTDRKNVTVSFTAYTIYGPENFEEVALNV